MRDIEKCTDEQLATLLSKSSEEAFTEIYNRFWQKLLAIAYIHTRDKTEAEEIVQEVMMSIWDRRETLNIQSVNRYLAVAVRFSILKRIHLQKRRSEIVKTEYQVSSSTLTEEDIDARFLQEYISGVVEQLPEKCRIVFQYSREQYKPNAQIAAELGISQKTVEAHLTRAIKVLRLNLRKAGIMSLMLFCWVF